MVYDFTGKSSEYTYGKTYQQEKKLFLCKECGPVFPQSGNLKRHMQTHNGEGPLNCSYVTCFGTTNSNMIMILEYVYIADPVKARGCSTNSFVIKSVRH